MRNVVADASVLLAFYLPAEPYKQAAMAVVKAFTEGRIRLVVPALAPYEFLNGLVRTVRGLRAGERLPLEEALAILQAFLALRVEAVARYPQGVWKCGRRCTLLVRENRRAMGPRREDTAMYERTTSQGTPSIPTWETLHTWLQEQAQGLIQKVLEAEVTELLGRARYQRRAEVDAFPGYRNGLEEASQADHAPGDGDVAAAPGVRGLEERFVSRILPLFARRTKEVGELLPELYLHELSGGGL